MASEWFYLDGEQNLGPFDADEIRKRRSAGTLTDATYVWREGMADWVPYSESELGSRKASGAAPAAAAVQTASKTQPAASRQAPPSRKRGTLLALGVLVVVIVAVLLGQRGTKSLTPVTRRADAWAVQTLPPSSSALQFTSVWASSDFNVYAVGYHKYPDSTSELLHFDGQSWSKVSDIHIPKNTFGMTLIGLNPKAIALAGWGFYGSFLRAYDGHSWSKVDLTGPGSEAMKNVVDGYPIDSDEAYVAANGEVKTRGKEMQGRVWHMTDPNPVSILTMPSMIDGLAVISRNDVIASRVRAIMHYDGNTWSEDAFNTAELIPDTVTNSRHTHPETLSSFWVAAPKDIFALGRGQPLFHYDGKVWKKFAPQPPTTSGAAVIGRASDDFFLADEDGVIYHFDGKDWAQSAKMDRAVYRFFRAPNGSIWGIGDDIIVRLPAT